ncbi:hypothetical protein Tco_0893430 [Tanacetum coccineum]|uniref:Reverse transcriptase Ty1/copia-type domain-containing protein n=1 Tax=Tanacetum coccineum TaxID=301880 RepID=A0ABQ5CBN9_9ASTR
MNVSLISPQPEFTRHPKDQIIGDINSATQTRRMTKISEEHVMVSYINKHRRTNHKDYQNCLFAYFLSQIEPKKVTQALTDPSWIEAMQEELLQFGLQKVKQKDDGIFISQDKYVADILKKFDFAIVKTTSTPIETNKALLKDEEAENVDVHLYRSMIGSLMYLTASRPDIMFAVCACARFQVTPKVLHLHAVKRIFRYLKGQPKLVFWYPRDSPFDLEAFFDSNYARASLDRKFTTRGCQFLDKRLISWQYKKQTIVANSTIEVEYVAAANYCRHVLWIQNQMLDYGFNFMNTKIYIDNESIICIVKNLVFHAKTKHIEIRHHFIRDSYEKRLIQITLAEPFNDVYQTPAHTKKVFTNMKRKGKDFSGRVTPLFASMLAPPVVEGEGSGQPSEPQPAPSTAQPRIEEQIPVTESSSPQNTQSPRQALQEDTQFPQTSVPIPNVADEAVFKEWDDRVVRATTTAASLDAAQASGNISKTQSMAMSNDTLSREISSGGNTPGSDEERIEQDDLTDFVPPTPHDSPLSGGHTPGSDEGRPNINELMAICTNLSNRVLALEQSKTAQDLVIRKLKKKVRKLEKKLRARTLGMKLFKIGTSKRKSLDEEYVSKQGRKSDKTKPMFDDSDFAELDVDNAMENVEGDAETQGRNTAEQITTNGDTVNTASIDDIFEDEMMTIADTLVAIRSTRPRTTSVVIRDVEKEPRRATPVPIVQNQDKGKGKMVEPEPTLKNPIKAQIQRDAEIAQRLHEEEKAKLERIIEADALLAARLQEKEREQFSIDEQARFLVEIIAKRKRFFAAQRAKQIRNKPPTKIQLRNKMITYLKNIEGGKKAVSSKKRPRAEPDEESVKRQKIRETSGSSEEQSAEKEKELSEEELQKLLVVVPMEEVYVEALQVKYPIIDWEVYSEGTRRDDLVKLWDLVKKRFSITEPTDDKEKELWVELKRLFEPDNDDTLWKLQRLGSTSGSDDENPPPPPPPQTTTQQAPHTVSTIKLPILKKGEYDIWAMKMEHYLSHTDYPIWEVIQKGNGPISVSTDTNRVIKVLPPKTAEEILAREREKKERTTLLMALPEDHLAKFHKMTDAKEMWDAIKSRFDGNDESKKMQKYILKQQFEGFSVSNSEGLHKGYDRFQSLLSQLEIHGAGVSTEDANQKFLRSLPSSWSQVSLVMRTKPGVDSLSFDDLYNNLRVFESDVKGSTGSSSSAQNVAFVSSESTSSTNDVSTAYGVSTSSGYNSQRENSSSYTDELMYSFFANQSSGPHLDHEDFGAA